ncbi:ATP-binding protein [Aliivibrio sp. S3MY1]|uniref:ATP-binding protein n=1 Tax=unclassified Aliivibrio TaxID=2645654 RepID=UPI002377E5E5|nr:MULTISPECIES: ATP-binding protein [unclassified Aliivibrio]MDD9194590.1 ATP-binding protein [Aliivibrio sp. S3MY1]MDD9198570.1 ATP-binding protein [Aliivibrio sp. S2MY1]
MSSNCWFTPFDSNRRIGSTINISPTEITANLSDAGSGEAKWHLGDRVAAGEVNEFVFIDCGQTAVLGRLVKVWLDGAERLSVDAISMANGLNNPIGIIQLLTSINSATGKISKGITNHPRLGSQIYSAHPKLISILAEGDTKEDDIKLDIAELPNDSTVNITVTPDKLFARHCAVLGATGGGKSYTMSRLLQEVQDNGGKALLLDPTGEYADLDCETYYVGNHDKATNENTVTFPHWKLPESDIVAFLRPSAQTQMPKLSAAILSQKVVIEHWKKRREMNLTLNESHSLVKADKEKRSYYGAVKLLESSSSCKRWSFKNLAAQIEQECIWPTGKFNEALFGGYHEGDLGYCISLISRIKSYSSNTYLKWLFDPEKDHQDIPSILENFSKNEAPNKILRLDLSAVSFEANGREILVNAIGRKLMGLARAREISHDNPLLVFIDEAHQFLNKSVGDEASTIKLDSFGNIAKEGRKYGLNVVIATQRPRDIPEDVLSQIGSLIVHRLTNFHDQEVVKRAVGSMDQRSASFLPTLSQGEALLLGIDFPFPMTVKMKTPNIKPTSKSAEYSSAWKRKISNDK